jgi:hypothetical protein
MNEELRHYDYQRLVEEARLQRSIALGNAIAHGLAALARGFKLLIAKIAGPRPVPRAQEPNC